MKNFCFSSISSFFQENFFQRKLFLFQKKDLLLRIKLFYFEKNVHKKKKIFRRKRLFFFFQ